ncbi:MAG TPA: hypothetical protein VMT14_15295 [Burkholderiaceae bacterium]|jgi:hypothetical protein|nr:hypothetical protein [Burkholderiaceae bacterium]
MNQLKAVCPICRGSGWLCDEHPAQPWEHEDCDGVGVACGCNSLAAVPHTDVFVEYDALNESMQ